MSIPFPKSGRKKCLLLEKIGKDKSHFAKGSFHVIRGSRSSIRA